MQKREEDLEPPKKKNINIKEVELELENNPNVNLIKNEAYMRNFYQQNNFSYSQEGEESEISE